MSRGNNTPGAVMTVRPVPSMTTRTPWNDMEALRRRMDDLFSSVTGYTPVSQLLNTSIDSDITPDVFETDTEMVFILPVPGIDPNEISVETTADTLTIKGERKPFFQNEGAVQHRQSWWSSRTGTFSLSYTLPVEINTDKVIASYRMGVLELHLPKAESVRPKAVKVSIAEEHKA